MAKKGSKKLTAKQELFCINYIKNDALRLNATLAYDEAYKIGLDKKDKTRELNEEGQEIYGTLEYDKAYNVCSVLGSRMLRNVKIQERNVELWNELLNNSKVDSRLSQIIFTGGHKDSLGGIKEYNKVNNRITERVNLTGTLSLLDLHKQSKQTNEENEKEKE